MVAEVEGLFGKGWPMGEAGVGEQGLCACAVGGEALFEADFAADAAGVERQAGELRRRVGVVLFERGDDVLFCLVFGEAVEDERFALGERGLRGGVGSGCRLVVARREAAWAGQAAGMARCPLCAVVPGCGGCGATMARRGGMCFRMARQAGRGRRGG